MTASTLTIVIAVASLLFLILGTVIAVLTIFTRRSDRNMERSEARQTGVLKQQEARQTEALNQFKAQILATLKRIEDGQADQNEQISELARAMYVLNG